MYRSSERCLQMYGCVRCFTRTHTERARVRGRWIIFMILNCGCAMAQVVSRRPLTAEVQGSRPGQSMWDLWRTVHSDRFVSEFFGFPLSISFHRRSPCSNIAWGGDNRPTFSRSSETQSHPIYMNMDIILECGWFKFQVPKHHL
jgi:hypothetical protein